MFRFTIRDLLWLMEVGLAIVILAIGQSGHVATLEGNACSVVAVTIVIAGVTRIYRQAKSRA